MAWYRLFTESTKKVKLIEKESRKGVAMGWVDMGK